MLLFTGARVSEVIGADVGDLGAERGRRVLRVTRGDGDRRSLPLPGPAAVRIDAYLARRPDLAGATGRPGQPEPGHGGTVLFATGTGRRLFAADVWRVMRRLAGLIGCGTRPIQQVEPVPRSELLIERAPSGRARGRPSGKPVSALGPSPRTCFFRIIL